MGSKRRRKKRVRENKYSFRRKCDWRGNTKIRGECNGHKSARID